MAEASIAVTPDTTILVVAAVVLARFALVRLGVALAESVWLRDLALVRALRLAFLFCVELTLAGDRLDTASCAGLAVPSAPAGFDGEHRSAGPICNFGADVLAFRHFGAVVVDGVARAPPTEWGRKT
jgi:hypothetical protein